MKNTVKVLLASAAILGSASLALADGTENAGDDLINYGPVFAAPVNGGHQAFARAERHQYQTFAPVQNSSAWDKARQDDAAEGGD